MRLGALPAFLALLLADRMGRRRVLLATIAGYTLCTGATALAPDFATFLLLQVLARLFGTVEFLLAMVVIVEEFRPHRRGVGIGALGTLAVCGHGAAMLGFGLVEVVPGGWRGFYAAGVLPLLVLGWLRRGIGETRLFAAARVDAPAPALLADWLRPLVLLLRQYPLRFWAAAAMGFLWSFSNAPVDFFLPKYFQEVHGWVPARFATVAVLGGALGLSGQVLVGWLSDRYGRRRRLGLATTLEALFAYALYTVLGPAAIALYVSWVFCSVASDVVGRTIGQEIFPTPGRATAAGVGAVAGTLGSVLGLACEALLFGALGTHWRRCAGSRSPASVCR